MKRIVSAFLALILLFSLAAVSGAEFYDEKDLPSSNRAAIDYAAAKEIISGFPDKDFKPKETLTRAQAAKMLCVALEGAAKANTVTQTATDFADVPQTHWASGSVAWCAKKSIVAGVGEGKFDPDAKLSAAAFAKMLLVAYGHDPQAEGLVGAQWLENTQKALKDSGFDKGVSAIRNQPLKRAEACQLVYNFVRAAEEKELEGKGYPLTEFPLTEKQNFRVLGRSIRDDKGLICDYSASGIEFTLDCAGTIWLSIDPAGGSSRFRAYVDGKRGESIMLSKNLSTMPLICDVEPGVHTIRIIRDTQVGKAAVRLTGVTASAKKETIKATEPKKLFIEINGDSISGGAGLLGGSKWEGSAYSAGLSYGLQAADLLNADCTIVSRGGIGFQKKVPSDLIFDYQNYYRDTETKYDFSRKPDVFVLALGTNDKKTEGYYEQYTKFIAQVRDRYAAPTLKIVIMYNMMTDRHTDTFLKIAEEDPNVWALKVPMDRAGKGHHPTIEGHAQYAQLLADFIKGIL